MSPFILVLGVVVVCILIICVRFMTSDKPAQTQNTSSSPPSTSQQTPASSSPPSSTSQQTQNTSSSPPSTSQQTQNTSSSPPSSTQPSTQQTPDTTTTYQPILTQYQPTETPSDQQSPPRSSECPYDDSTLEITTATYDGVQYDGKICRIDNNTFVCPDEYSRVNYAPYCISDPNKLIFDNCPSGYYPEKTDTHQVCREANKSLTVPQGTWVCPPNMKQLNHAPFCVSDPNNEIFADCPSGYLPEHSSTHQLCRQIGAIPPRGAWTCPPNMKKINHAPFCVSDPDNKIFNTCPSGYLPEYSDTHQVCRQAGTAFPQGPWVCPSDMQSINSPPFCVPRV